MSVLLETMFHHFQIGKLFTDKFLGHKTHCLATDAEVLTVAVIAAKSFANNHKNALYEHGLDL